MNSQTLIEQALALPEHERMRLVERLLESLPPDDDLLDEEAFSAELRRRSDEFDKDPSIGIPWEQLRDELD
jgi:putative addiction module component (TIGR02574 family)